MEKRTKQTFLTPKEVAFIVKYGPKVRNAFLATLFCCTERSITRVLARNGVVKPYDLVHKRTNALVEEIKKYEQMVAKEYEKEFFGDLQLKGIRCGLQLRISKPIQQR